MIFDCPHCGAHLFRPHYPDCPGRLEPARDLCVFCGRRPEETAWLAGEPGRHICDRCVARCQRVLSGEDEAVGEVAVAVGGGMAAVGAGADEADGVDEVEAPEAAPPPPPPDVDWYGPPRTERCGYCGRGRDEVHRLVAGPKVAICDTCVYDIAVQRGGAG